MNIITVYVQLKVNGYTRYVDLYTRLYFGWLLGDCVSKTTTDISKNQTPMVQDWQEQCTMQTMSTIVLRQQRHTGG